jgi:hypothetical protein
MRFVEICSALNWTSFVRCYVATRVLAGWQVSRHLKIGQVQHQSQREKRRYSCEQQSDNHSISPGPSHQVRRT